MPTPEYLAWRRVPDDGTIIFYEIYVDSKDETKMLGFTTSFDKATRLNKQAKEFFEAYHPEANFIDVDEYLIRHVILS